MKFKQKPRDEQAEADGTEGKTMMTVCAKKYFTFQTSLLQYQVSKSGFPKVGYIASLGGFLVGQGEKNPPIGRFSK